MKARLQTFAPFVAAPAKSAHNRQMPGVVVLDHDNRICVANKSGVRMLSSIAGVELYLETGSALPCVLQPLVEELVDRISKGQDSCAVMVPTYDLCVRACAVSGQQNSGLLLLIERASREDIVRGALASYPLTPREAEVAALVLRGYSNRHIADYLVLTEYTIEDHLKRIFAKVGVRSRSALASKILGIRGKEEAAV